MQIRIDQTEIFAKWLRKLKDRRARLIINTHLDRMANGNFGDCKSVGDGVIEKRINYGAGYRLYYLQNGKVWIILLCGGDKSTQQDDIKEAKQLRKDVNE